MPRPKMSITSRIVLNVAFVAATVPFLQLFGYSWRQAVTLVGILAVVAGGLTLLHLKVWPGREGKGRR
jgi:hypothetical protein